MRLTALKPAWFAAPGRVKMGVVFDCPCERCVRARLPAIEELAVDGQPYRLAIPFRIPMDGGEPFSVTNRTTPGGMFEALEGKRRIYEPGLPGQQIVFFSPKCVIVGGVLWDASGDSFEILTLAPSVDASPAGHWHGFVQGGEIKFV